VSPRQRIPHALPRVLKNCAQGLANGIARHRIWAQTAIAPKNEYCFQ
jgi:hypothetical protein